MLDAVQNHTAEVVVIDEIRDAKEVVEAAKTIANEGVMVNLSQTFTDQQGLGLGSGATFIM